MRFLKRKQTLKVSHSILSVLVTLSLTLLPILSAVLPPAGVALANPLTATVTPASLIAGAAGNATVTFTSLANLTASDKIAVTFPAGFQVASTSATSSTINSGLTAVAGSNCGGTDTQAVCVTRDGLGSLVLTSAMPVSFVINGITNPANSGITSTFAVAHKNAANSPQDNGTAAAVTITPGTLTSALVVPGGGLVAGATEGYTFNFTSPTTGIPTNGDRIVIVFPSGYNAAGATITLASGSLGTGEAEGDEDGEDRMGNLEGLLSFKESQWCPPG